MSIIPLETNFQNEIVVEIRRMSLTNVFEKVCCKITVTLFVQRWDSWLFLFMEPQLPGSSYPSTSGTSPLNSDTFLYSVGSYYPFINTTYIKQIAL